MNRRAALALAVSLVAGCGDAAAPHDVHRSTAPPADSASVAPPPPMIPTKLVRKTQPRDRRLADEKACEEEKDLAACRHAADRHRGYGHVAGCGVDREGKKPRRQVTADDDEADAIGFDTWIRKACDLGDEEACQQGKNNVSSSVISETRADACARSSLADCPLHMWQSVVHPEKAKQIEVWRRRFMRDGVHGVLFIELYRRAKAKDPTELPPEIAEVAERICKTTGECDDAFMMLDKDGYTEAALAGLRKKAGEHLAAACLDGDCVCGEAARYLPPDDARVLDLARIGCDAGEPEACFVLGDLYERGAGVEKSAKTAFGLFELACPPVIASDGREDIYSRLACDRLSERYEEGTTLQKNRDRAFFYASRACDRPGFARDQALCVHRAVFHGLHEYVDRERFLLVPTQAARLFMNGPDQNPVDAKECDRPSVRELCKQHQKLR